MSAQVAKTSSINKVSLVVTNNNIFIQATTGISKDNKS